MNFSATSTPHISERLEKEATKVRATQLANGTTILTETMPGLRSATIGIWIARGSRHEPAELNGICHFIEHAVFKGTARRTALDIAVESDRLGGHFDAYTSHEITGFSLKVIDAAAAQAFDLLADMLLNPRFDETELEREQRVIIEEMKMVEDSPEEHLLEIFSAAYFPDHSLGRPIEGTAETVSTFNHERTARFHAYAYRPQNFVVAAAGNICHDQIVELAARAFDEFAAARGAADGANYDDLIFAERSFMRAPRAAAPIFVKRKRGLEQAQMILAAPWASSRDEERYAATLLGSILGGGTSSRLWQRVREERGLAYAVGAAASNFNDAGFFQIYAGTSPAQLDEVLDLALNELRRIVSEPVSEAELRLVKEQAKASILLGLESTSARAGTLARQLIVHGRRVTPDEIIARLEAVTPDEIQRVAQKYFRTEAMAFGALGAPRGFRVDRARLEI
jgi:predicted Zn-dependent peptidase